MNVIAAVKSINSAGCQEEKYTVGTRDIIFRKMTNRNQTETNEMATTETKYRTDFILPKNTNVKPNFKATVLKMPIKYQQNTKKYWTEIPNTALIPVFPSYTKFLVTD